MKPAVVSKFERGLSLVEFPGSAGRAFNWDDMIVMDNVSRVPSPIAAEGDFLWNRGFKVLLLNSDGAPAYICKCRPSSDQFLAHETEIRTKLSKEPSLHRVIPWTRGVKVDQIQLQLSRYVEGKLYQDLVVRLSMDEWVASVKSVLDASFLACSAYERLERPTLHGQRLNPWAAAEPFIGDLRSAGMRPDLLKTVEDFLRNASPFRPMVQHGDLWPRNVIYDGANWWLLDFEYIGDTLIPMYDVYQLLRTCVLLRLSGGGARREPNWFDSMTRGDALAVAVRDLIRHAAERLGVDGEQAMVRLVNYLVEVTARLLRRRVPLVFRQSFVLEVERVATTLQSGVDLRTVFWPLS
jgi:hypothetical protein